MKHLKLLVIILFTLSLSLTAQDTDAPILSSDNVWVQYRGGWFTQAPERYSFDIDSTYFGTHYYKTLQISSDSTGNNWTNLEEYYRHEDGRIYNYNPDGDDFLRFDFNLMVGDTFTSNLSSSPDLFFYTVSTIDSILLENGEKKKRLGMQCYHDEVGDYLDYWIEDVGATNGGISNTIEFACASDIHYNLVCFHSGDNLLYEDGNDFYNGCWYTVSTNKINIPQLKMWPNPTASNLNFSMNDNYSDFEYTIYDNLGKVIQKGTLNDSIDVENLSKGIYIMEISKDYNSQSYKFVKE